MKLYKAISTLEIMIPICAIAKTENYKVGEWFDTGKLMVRYADNKDKIDKVFTDEFVLGYLNKFVEASAFNANMPLDELVAYIAINSDHFESEKREMSLAIVYTKLAILLVEASDILGFKIPKGSSPINFVDENFHSVYAFINELCV